MWVMLNDAFFSIVKKDCARDEVLVRARRKNDIEKVFESAKVTRDVRADYLYRAPIKTELVVEAMAGEVRRITYGNFKDSVTDDTLHNAYLRVWSAMLTLQPPKREPEQFRMLSPSELYDQQGFDDETTTKPKKRKPAQRRSRRGL